MPVIRTKLLIPIIALLSIIWLTANYLLAERFSISGSDGVMYSLPLAVAKNPLDLGIPFLNDFEGYGSSWGHQWPGAMWIKGFVFWIIPYSRIADVLVLATFQWLAAGVAAVFVWRTTGAIWASSATWIILLSDRLMLASCWSNRFETIAIALLLILFADSLGSSSEPKESNARSGGNGSKGEVAWRFIVRISAFLCPTAHPYALALGLMIICYNLACAWIFKNEKPRDACWKTGCFISGILATVAWFATQPGALHQFETNIALQKSFFSNWNTVLDGLRTNYRLCGGVLLWAAALWVGIKFAIGPVKKREGGSAEPPVIRFLTPGLFLAVIAIHTVTRCENFYYLSFGAPFAVILVCVYGARTTAIDRKTAGRRFRWADCVPLFIVALVLSLHATIIPFRMLQFIRAGCPDLRRETAAVLGKMPTGHTVYIPYIMWPAATEDRRHDIRWFTLPIASRKESRGLYEKTAYAKAKPGDMLIIDDSVASALDKFGLKPTFNTSPPDPSQWRFCYKVTHLFQGAVKWGIDLSVYEFMGQ